MMKRVLITGNLGYNGVWVTNVLKRTGHQTIGFDCNYYEEGLFEDDEFAPDHQILKDLRQIAAADLDGIDVVVHLAALSNDATGELNPHLTRRINQEASIRLARLAKRQGVRKFLYASSCSIYGISESDSPVTEDAPVAPLTAYARAKVEAESELLRLHDETFRVVIMRNATMHGLSPKLRLDLVLNNLVASAYLEGRVRILSDGTPWRPLLSVLDFALAVLLFLDCDVKHVVYNVGFDEENYQVKALGRMISDLTGATLEINPARTPDERSYRVAFTRLQREFPEFRLQMPVRASAAGLLAAYETFGLTRADFTGPKFFRIRTLKDLIARGVLDEHLERMSCCHEQRCP
jgi:nucleoside-diphosphate-sugar epimerase